MKMTNKPSISFSAYYAQQWDLLMEIQRIEISLMTIKSWLRIAKFPRKRKKEISKVANLLKKKRKHLLIKRKWIEKNSYKRTYQL